MKCIKQIKMKKQPCKKRPGFITMIIFGITFLLFNASCSKDTKSPDLSKPTAGSSPIVYTDVKPDSVIIKMAPALYNLDLNNDGIIDFQFSSTERICGDGLVTAIIRQLYISIAPASGGIVTNNVIPNPLYLVTAFDSSAVIAPGSLWVSTPQISTPQFLLYGASRPGYNVRCMGAYGYWLNVSDKYLGLKFIKGNSTYYGWARLTSTYSATPGPYRYLTMGQLILKDYAYNSSPNQPILAGQTK